jgi:two-component system response regulator YesN
MLKIYLVEDDAAIRESMIRNVKWEQHGYEFVGQAPDGEIAYSEIRKLRPDVVITDLKMPFMDGMELSRLIRKEMPEIKIIILTGYDDFEFVHEALNIGVAKFLLKPATPDAIANVIADMRDVILQEQENRTYVKQYLEELAKIQDLTSGEEEDIRIDRDALKSFLRSGSLGDTKKVAENLVNSVGTQRMDSFLLRKHFIVDTKFAMAEFLEEIGVDNAAFVEKMKEANIQPSEIKTASETISYLEELIRCALSLRNEAANKRYDGSVEKARKYIVENYMSEDISLNAVSGFVGLSPTHFSMIFSQESGKTFIEFLTETRIEKAKELLLCTPKRSSEIAYEVGFRDSHYFSFVFKKVAGCSPRVFRAGAKVEGDV